MTELQAFFYLVAIVLFLVDAFTSVARPNLLALGLASAVAGLAVPVFDAVLS